MTNVPEVLFVCVHNAGRSQMAAALLDHHAEGRVTVRSAGSVPADTINPAVVAAMGELGLDLSKEYPKPLTDDAVRAADVVVAMGCGDACPVHPGKRYLNWELADPAGRGIDAVRAIRDEIDERVRGLLAELTGTTIGEVGSPYADPSSLRRIAEAYGDGASLDAKWAVMREHRTAEATFEDWLLAMMPLAARARVLDVGAGSGRFAIPLARRLGAVGGTVVALDVLHDVMTPIRRAVTEERLAIETVVADGGEPGVELGSFDVVLAAHMLYHLDDIVAGIRSMRRRLRPGGLFVATTNASVGMPELFDLHVATMRALELAIHDGPPPRGFTVENGAALLGEVFPDVRTEVYDGGFTAPSADPVFAYYAGTELYRAPMRDAGIPFETRMRIAPTFVHLTQRVIDARARPLLIRKPMGAFLCR